jgi:hypothetical protein
LARDYFRPVPCKQEREELRFLGGHGLLIGSNDRLKALLFLGKVSFLKKVWSLPPFKVIGEEERVLPLQHTHKETKMGKGNNKEKLFNMMGKSDLPVCWLHPMSVPFVRANFPDVPIACAIGNKKWWFLNGDDSFYFKNDKYASYKVMVKSEEKIRQDLSQKYNLTQKNKKNVFLNDSINGTYSWVEIGEDLEKLYAHDAMSSFLFGELRRKYSRESIKYDRDNRPSYFLPNNQRVKTVDGLIGYLKYPKQYNISEEGFHKNIRIESEFDGKLYDVKECDIRRIA